MNSDETESSLLMRRMVSAMISATGTPVPEAHQEAARAQGKARFEQFVEQLGRHLLRGRSLVRDVVEELHPQVHEFGMRMEDAAAVAQARERAS